MRVGRAGPYGRSMLRPYAPLQAPPRDATLHLGMPNTRIVATGRAVPERVVTNDDLSKLMDTTDEWIRQRTGIQQRHWAVEGDSATGFSLLATAARPRQGGDGGFGDRRDRLRHLHLRSLRSRQRRLPPEGPRHRHGAGARHPHPVQRLCLRPLDRRCLYQERDVPDGAGGRVGAAEHRDGRNGPGPQHVRDLRRWCRRRDRAGVRRGGRFGDSRVGPPFGRRTRRAALGRHAGEHLSPAQPGRAHCRGEGLPRHGRQGSLPACHDADAGVDQLPCSRRAARAPRSWRC